MESDVGEDSPLLSEVAPCKNFWFVLCKKMCSSMLDRNFKDW